MYDNIILKELFMEELGNLIDSKTINQIAEEEMENYVDNIINNKEEMEELYINIEEDMNLWLSVPPIIYEIIDSIILKNL